MSTPRLTERGRLLLGVGVVVLLVVGIVAVVLANRGGGHGTAQPPPTSSTPRTSSTPPSTPSTTDNSSAVAAAESAVQALVASAPDDGAFVAAVNTVSGAKFTTGTNAGNWTASCYKLVLLEILLLQHQQQGTSMGSGEVANATSAIENSDNVAGYQLWLDVGRNPGMQAVLPTLGLTHAVAEGSDPTFTRLTPPDTMALLNNLVSSTSPLNSQSRSFALGLMRNVETDQRWGAGAAADPNTEFANKNGWLAIDNNGPGESDNGRWVVNSLGIVTIGGDQVLLAVFSEHNDSFDSGVALIEKMAKAVRPIVSG